MTPINRRSLLTSLGLVGGFSLFGRSAMAAMMEPVVTRGMASPKIKDIQVIECQPNGVRITVVKVTTDQPGLYGYGCATFTQRADLVRPAVEKYLKPLLMGRDTDRIEDTWQMCYDSSYWKNGPILNNAISGIDQALWDIKGRQAGLPVYQLVGGKSREAVETYVHANGDSPAKVVEAGKRLLAEGYRNLSVRGGEPASPAPAPAVLHSGTVFDPRKSMRDAIALLETCRTQLGEDVGLSYDVHERVSPNQAVNFCKAVEKLDLFFLEDPLSPEDLDYFRQIRQSCSTPIAMGELFNNPHEWQTLIEEHLIDYIRCHLSQVGGFTPGRKIAVLAEQFGVKTAWHGPGDLSPVGQMAQMSIDISIPNFGIQEFAPFSEQTRSIFKGCPDVKNGYLYVNESPGWGIEVDEQAAAKFPFTAGRANLNGGWGDMRLPDGTVIKQ
jgi:mannonate dehydratase